MKTEETDLFFKKMMTSSSLEISKTGFNNIVMQKIMLQEKKKLMKRAILCCFLALLTLGIIIFLLIITLKPATGSSGQIIEPFWNNILDWVGANQFLLTPIILVLIIQKIISTRTKYSS